MCGLCESNAATPQKWNDMTTEAAERAYLAEHLRDNAGRALAVWNPRNRPVSELPVIYGFNNGGSPGWFSAVALSADGVCLGGHVCSSEGYMPHDLGILEGTRPDRHAEQYQKHYPDGYRMEFVSSEDIRGHAGLQAAIKIAEAAASSDASHWPTTASTAKRGGKVAATCDRQNAMLTLGA